MAYYNPVWHVQHMQFTIIESLIYQKPLSTWGPAGGGTKARAKKRSRKDKLFFGCVTSFVSHSANLKDREATWGGACGWEMKSRLISSSLSIYSSHLVLSYCVLSYLIFSVLFLSFLTFAHLISSDLILSYPVSFHLLFSFLSPSFLIACHHTSHLLSSFLFPSYLILSYLII